ncbi:MAG: hypothetical protein ACTTHG_00630 [Treponemataceae bacterium]
MKNRTFQTFLLSHIAEILLVSLFFTSCDSLLQSKIAIANANATLNLTDLVNNGEIKKLSTPHQVIVSKCLSASEIKINWSDVEHVQYYTLERAIVDPTNPDIQDPPDDSQFLPIKSYIKDTNYTDKVLLQPKYNSKEYTAHYKYYYRVYAENPEKSCEPSDPSSNLNYGTLFEPVTNVSADMGIDESKITVRWSKTKNASKYEVYRSQNKTGPWEWIASVNKNLTIYDNYVTQNEQGIKFFYKIVAYNSKNESTADSPSAIGYSLKEGAPGVPDKITVSRGEEGKIIVSWSNGTFNSSKSKDGKLHYTIYASTSYDSGKIQLSASDGTYDEENRKFIYNKAKEGVYYFFYISPWFEDHNDEKVIGGITNPNNSDINEENAGFVLSAPSSVYVTKTSGKKICFTPSMGNEIEQNSYTYTIYGFSTQTSSPVEIQSGIQQGILNSNGMIEVNLFDTYEFYKVQTVCNEKKSGLSFMVSPAPYAATDAIASKANSNPYFCALANVNGVYPVKITWKQPENDSPAGYEIYRSTRHNTGFKKINTESVKNCEYIDVNENSRTQTFYYYKVLSLNELGQGTNFSNVTCGYGALNPAQYFREFNKTIKRSQKKLTLMHKSGNTEKLGSETKNGDLSGTIGYNAVISGLGAEITMPYKNYADFEIPYMENNFENKMYVFFLNGSSDTSANMSSNGNMHGSITATNCMYPGVVCYDEIRIISGVAGAGNYVVTPSGYSGEESTRVSYVIGSE